MRQPLARRWRGGEGYDVHRLIAWLQVLVLAVVAVPIAITARGQRPAVPDLWSAAVAVGLMVSFVAALRGRDRACAWGLWGTSVVGALVLPHVVGSRLPDPVWLAQMSQVTIGMTVLLARRAWVCGLLAVVLLAAGSASRQVVVETPGRDSLVGLVSLVGTWFCALVVVRALELGQQRSDRMRVAAVEDYVAARAEEAAVRAEQAWDAYLHDEVVATMAVIADGEPETARAAARRLLDTGESFGGRQVPTPLLASGALDAVLRHRPDADTDFRFAPDSTPPPQEVRRAVLEALSEALRNVDRHAYHPHGHGPCRVRVRVEADRLEVTVTDEGVGFDPAAVPESRLGLSVSVQGRMDAVGGWSRLRSVPGQGTRLELGWERQAEPW